MSLALCFVVLAEWVSCMLRGGSGYDHQYLSLRSFQAFFVDQWQTYSTHCSHISPAIRIQTSRLQSSSFYNVVNSMFQANLTLLTMHEDSSTNGVAHTVIRTRVLVPCSHGLA